MVERIKFVREFMQEQSVSVSLAHRVAMEQISNHFKMNGVVVCRHRSDFYHKAILVSIQYVIDLPRWHIGRLTREDIQFLLSIDIFEWFTLDGNKLTVSLLLNPQGTC